MPRSLETIEAGSHVVRESEKPLKSAVLISGCAVRHKTTRHGARQILAVHIPGEFLDLETAFSAVAGNNVQALTQCRIALVPHAAIRALTQRRPAVGMALWLDTLLEGSIAAEWIVNVGRRDSRTRVAHLLCEIGRRLEEAGFGPRSEYRLPMTQEQLADAAGLTPVHVNRVLKGLDRDGLVERSGRTIMIPDWEKLCAVADFDERYLFMGKRPAGGLSSQRAGC